MAGMEGGRRRRQSFDGAVAKLQKLTTNRRITPLALGRVLKSLDAAERTEAARQIGLSRRTAYYLACIARAVDDALMREEDLAVLGWARARALAAAAVKSGKRVSRAALTEAMGKPARQVSSVGVGGRSLLDFALTPRQAELVRDALAVHGAPPGAGPEARAAALAAICRARKGG